MEETFAVGLRVGERALAVVHWGVRMLGRPHHRRRIIVGHSAYMRRRGCSLQVVVSRAGGITQGILEAQEVVDGVGVALRHAHELGCGLEPLGSLVHLSSVDARSVA